MIGHIGWRILPELSSNQQPSYKTKIKSKKENNISLKNL